MKSRAMVWMAGVLVLVGCTGSRPVSQRPGLLSTRWVQTSAEYTALALQAYVDVDETVLDNSPYQAWLVTTGRTFSPESWARWVQAAQAEPVPGAVAFVQEALRHGVQVFYVTNRTSDLEEATRRNLQAVGFPLPDTLDVILTRGERPEWASSDKEPRRAFLGQRYRILLQIGDQLGDFMSDPETRAEARRALVRRYRSWWGTRWIVLPNPQYGAWQRAPDSLRTWPGN